MDFLYRFEATISFHKDKYLEKEGSFIQFPLDSKKKGITIFIKKNFNAVYGLFSKRDEKVPEFFENIIWLVILEKKDFRR